MVPLYSTRLVLIQKGCSITNNDSMWRMHCLITHQVVLGLCHYDFIILIWFEAKRKLYLTTHSVDTLYEHMYLDPLAVTPVRIVIVYIDIVQWSTAVL